jgi:hypothetical protein
LKPKMSADGKVIEPQGRVAGNRPSEEDRSRSSGFASCFVSGTGRLTNFAETRETACNSETVERKQVKRTPPGK